MAQARAEFRVEDHQGACDAEFGGAGLAVDSPTGGVYQDVELPGQFGMHQRKLHFRTQRFRREVSGEGLVIDHDLAFAGRRITRATAVLRRPVATNWTSSATVTPLSCEILKDSNYRARESAWVRRTAIDRILDQRRNRQRHLVGFALWQGGGTLQLADLALFLAVLAAGIGYAEGGACRKRWVASK